MKRLRRIRGCWGGKFFILTFSYRHWRLFDYYYEILGMTRAAVWLRVKISGGCAAANFYPSPHGGASHSERSEESQHRDYVMITCFRHW
jgi:hypothetical protein